jgi:hypothetical protein
MMCRFYIWIKCTCKVVVPNTPPSKWSSKEQKKRKEKYLLTTGSAQAHVYFAGKRSLMGND